MGCVMIYNGEGDSPEPASSPEPNQTQLFSSQRRLRMAALRPQLGSERSELRRNISSCNTVIVCIGVGLAPGQFTTEPAQGSSQKNGVICPT